MIPQNRSPKKKRGALIARPCSLNLLSGNVSSSSFTRVPLVTRAVPFSLTRGMIGRKQAGIPGGTMKRANRPSTDTKLCPWCGETGIRTEMKSGKRALWACLGCQKRWWASLDDPAEVVRARLRLRRGVFAGTIWERFGGFGLRR